MNKFLNKVGRGVAAAVGFVGLPATYLVATTVITVALLVALAALVVVAPFYAAYNAFKSSENVARGVLKALGMFLLTLISAPLGAAVVLIGLAIVMPLVAVAAVLGGPALGAYKGWTNGFVSVLKDIFSFLVPEVMLMVKIGKAETDAERDELFNDYMKSGEKREDIVDLDLDLDLDAGYGGINDKRHDERQYPNPVFSRKGVYVEEVDAEDEDQHQRSFQPS